MTGDLSTQRLQDIVGAELAKLKPLWVIQNSTHFFKAARCEVDVLSQARSGLLVEVEIKRTTSDAAADSRKRRWDFMEEVVVDGRIDLSSPLLGVDRIPSRHYMAAEPGVIRDVDLHPWSGLIEIDPYGDKITVVKRAPLLHSERPNFFRTMRYIARRSTRREFG